MWSGVHFCNSEMNTSKKLLSTLVVIMALFHRFNADDLPHIDTELEHDYVVKAAHECHDQEGLPARWLNVSLRRVSVEVVAISAIFEVDLEVPDTINFLLEVQLFHQDGDDVNERTRMMDYAMTQVCKKMKDRESEVMNAFLDSIDGVDCCPIKQGEYPIVDFQVKIKDLKPFLRDGLMILRLVMILEGETISCTTIELRVTPCEKK